MLLVLFSFGRSKEKEPKRKLADCTSAAKLASLLAKRRKTVASLTLRCGAFNAITSQSFHAAPVRSVFGCVAIMVNVQCSMFQEIRNNHCSIGSQYAFRMELNAMNVVMAMT